MIFQSLKIWLVQHMPMNSNQETVAIYQQLVTIFINISRSMTENYSDIANFQREHLSD